ncbi:unnamed protein product [Adineta ricciae]|uniref:Uncharacterized protein n=1 Tax=Adineta ricciae TaxID=249248 RepID=A0A814PDE6_ADIRI|nr:unnamed protein product [Adineta ricciae]CAF1347012.1 unnamed protein product [Adineta ricciae]
MNGTAVSSMFDEMNRMMTAMHQRFQHLMNSAPFPSDNTDDRKQLDAVEPVCNTTVSSSSSSEPYRRKKLRQAKLTTTTCIKELVVNGKKQIFKATNVTDENGVLISENKVYQTISINTNNQTLPADVIAY